MTSNQIRTELNELYSVLLDKGVAIFTQPTHIEYINSKTQRLTWPNNPPGFNATAGEFGTIKQYLNFLEQASYSCLLNDGALLRISYSIKRDSIVGHNLWYYPCPIKCDHSELKYDDPIEVIKLYLEQLKNIRLKTPMRFDYDPDNARPGHPSSHVHFQLEECRQGVQSAISPGKFIKFILANFYPHEWNDDWEGWNEWDLPMTIETQERNKIHMGWISNF